MGEWFRAKKEGRQSLPLVNGRTVIDRGYNKTADVKLVCVEINPVKERGAEAGIPLHECDVIILIFPYQVATKKIKNKVNRIVSCAKTVLFRPN